VSEKRVGYMLYGIVWFGILGNGG